MKIELGRCRLKDIRLKIGWTQRQLSKATGIPAYVLSRYENGKGTVTFFNAILITETIYVKTGVLISPRDLYDVITH